MTRVRILDGTRLGVGNPDRLSAALSDRLGVPVRRTAERLDLDRAWDASRRQHQAGVLMEEVLRRVEATNEKCVALVDVDLFIPVLTFVFGQAQLGGAAGIVSTFRLANPFYGLPRDDGLLRHRIEKEVLHELGHMFGLYHCRHFECVMRSSTYVEEIDLKRAWFCPHCNERLRAGRDADGDAGAAFQPHPSPEGGP
jgi:archaemetzincin